MRGANITDITVANQTFRVATWRIDGTVAQHPPVLFFNGIGANIETASPLSEAFDDRPFITFDMPGTGGSAEPHLPYSYSSMAWSAVRILDVLKVGTVDIIGFSWGGALAQQFALQHPKYTRHVVLAGTNAGSVAVPGHPLKLARMFDPRRLLEAALDDDVPDGRPVRNDPNLPVRFAPPTPRGLFYQLLAMAGWTSAFALPVIDKKVLVIAGEKDRIVPPVNGTILASLLPDARLEIIKGGGHMFLNTHFEECRERMRDFLDQADTEAAQAIQ